MGQLVERFTGDVIPASDHNDVKAIIEDATYPINTDALSINDTVVISDDRVVTNVTGNISMFTNDSGYISNIESESISDLSDVDLTGIDDDKILKWSTDKFVISDTSSLIGPQGAQGEQGHQGEQGDQGDTGAQGSTGSQGDQGHQGHQGFQGVTGVQGATGSQGDDGAQGEQGVQGHQGDTGAQGEQGHQGNQGLKGDQGDQGLNGGLNWIIKNANYTIQDGEGVFADTSDGAWTLTLPLSPAVGDVIGVSDSKSSFDINNLTINRNGSLIYGLAENLICNVKDASFNLIYSSAESGWRIDTYLTQGYDEVITGPQGSQGDQGAQGDEGPTINNMKGSVVHGATADTARPSGFETVEWIGSVEPTNMANNDTWIDTSE